MRYDQMRGTEFLQRSGILGAHFGPVPILQLDKLRILDYPLQVPLPTWEQILERDTDRSQVDRYSPLDFPVSEQ